MLAAITILIAVFCLGLMLGIIVQRRETDKIHAMWKKNREMMRQHFAQCLGLKPLLLLCLALAACGPDPSVFTTPAHAAQLAPNYQHAIVYPCDGVQRDTGFALDYAAAMYLRHSEMLIVGALPGQYGTVTLSIAVPPGQPAPFLTGMGGYEVSAHVDWGVNGKYIPAAQALAVEYSCFGGGNRTLLMTLDYTSQPGPNP